MTFFFFPFETNDMLFTLNRLSKLFDFIRSDRLSRSMTDPIFFLFFLRLSKFFSTFWISSFSSFSSHSKIMSLVVLILTGVEKSNSSILNLGNALLLLQIFRFQFPFLLNFQYNLSELLVAPSITFSFRLAPAYFFDRFHAPQPESVVIFAFLLENFSMHSVVPQRVFEFVAERDSFTNSKYFFASWHWIVFLLRLVDRGEVVCRPEPHRSLHLSEQIFFGYKMPFELSRTQI